MNFFEIPFETGFDKDRFLSFKEVQDALKSEKFILPLVDKNCINRDTLDLLQEKFRANIAKTRLFVYPPMHMSGIHIDGLSISTTTKYAVNFPIQNCLGTKMIFYKLYPETDSSKIQIYHNDSSHSISYDMRSVERILEELEITNATVVNTSIPHNVYSPIVRSRAILSIRFANAVSRTVDSLYDEFHNTSP